jgi:predicted TIM-barrel fold metal-dependent hydrolase
VNPQLVIDGHVTAGAGIYFDTDPEQLIEAMDRYGIGRAVLAPSDGWLAVDNREGNDQILAWARRWPGRLLGYATANPWYGERALAELERALDAGLHGIKLHPARQGFMLLEPIVEPILALAARRRVPVYVVTGVPVASMPLQLAELARRFPETQLIMGRSGRTDFSLDLLPAAQLAPNIYIETAYNLPATLGVIAQAIGPGRLLFASDAPFTNLELELGKLELIPEWPAMREAVLGANLARLLRLDP